MLCLEIVRLLPVAASPAVTTPASWPTEQCGVWQMISTAPCPTALSYDVRQHASLTMS